MMHQQAISYPYRMLLPPLVRYDSMFPSVAALVGNDGRSQLALSSSDTCRIQYNADGISNLSCVLRPPSVLFVSFL